MTHRAGVFAAPEDTEALASAIEWLADHPADRVAMEQLAAEGGLLLGVPIVLAILAFCWEVRRRLRGDRTGRHPRQPLPVVEMLFPFGLISYGVVRTVRLDQYRQSSIRSVGQGCCLLHLNAAIRVPPMRLACAPGLD